MNQWEWKVPKGHGSDQPVLEWWFEQIALVILLKVGVRAHKRGDEVTFLRMRKVLNAGAAAEKEN